MYVGAAAASCFLLAFVIVGFFAGYRGTWKHTAAAVATIAVLFLLPQVLNLILFHRTVALTKVLGGIFGMAGLIILGSLIGSLYVKGSQDLDGR